MKRGTVEVLVDVVGEKMRSRRMSQECGICLVPERTFAVVEVDVLDGNDGVSEDIAKGTIAKTF